MADDLGTKIDIPFSDDGLVELWGRGGGKGGAGSGHTPTEDPNTLQANNIVRVIEILSEGEIEGPALGSWLKSTFFDNVAAIAQDNTVNLKGITLDARLGLPDQAPLEGFPDTESVVPVNVIVPKATPVVRTFGDALAEDDAVRIIVSLPQGLSEQDTKTGDLHGFTVEFKVEVKASGGAYVERLRQKITGKATAAYQEQYRVPLDGVGPWDVRVTRISNDDSGVTQNSDLYWASYVRIIDRKMIYPDTALVGVTVNAQTFGNSIPTRSYEIKGVKWDIPDNYDPVARTYTGSWTGTFDNAFTNCPPWALNGLMINERFGLGDLFTQDDIDKWTFYSLAQYCDGWRARYTAYTVAIDANITLTAPLQWTKSTGVGAWDNQVRSLQSYTGGAGVHCVAKTTNKAFMFGLNTDPTTNSNYTSIDYGMHVKANGKLEAWVNGVISSATDAWTYALNDKLAVIYDNDYVRFYQNGVLLHSVNVAAGLTLFMDSSLYTVGAIFSDVGFGPDDACGCVDDYSFHGRNGVPDGDGGWEPRFTFNGVLRTRENALSVLEAVAGMMRCALLWSGGQLSATQDSPKTAVKGFSPANVIDGMFDYTGSAITARHTVAYVSWNNPDKNYDPDLEVVEDRGGIARYGYNDTDITAIGCTSRGQARRAGLFLLATEQSETDTVNFKVALEHADVAPGQIIKISDPIFTAAAYAGRLLAVGTTFSLTPTNMVFTSGALVKAAGGAAWDSQAYTAAFYTGGAIAVAQAADADKSVMFGLQGATPAASASYGDIDYAWFLKTDGTCEAWAAGALVSAEGAYVAGDVFSVEYDNDYVRYLKNGVVMHFIDVAAGLTFYFDSTFFTVGATLFNPRFLPYSALTTVTMDREFVFAPGRTYLLNYYKPDGTLALEVPINNPSATTALVTFTTPLLAMQLPAPGAGFVLESDQVEARLFRVMQVREEDRNTFSITALQYNPDKFASVDKGVLPSGMPADFSDLPNPNYCTPPTDIVATFQTQLVAGIQRGQLKIEWTPPVLDRFLKDYTVWVQFGNGNWAKYEHVISPELTIMDPDLVVVRIKVQACNQAGKPSTAAVHSINLATGNYTAKSAVVHSLQVVGGSTTAWEGRTIRLSWKFRSPYTLATATQPADGNDPFFDYFRVDLCTGGTDTVLSTFTRRVSNLSLGYDLLAALAGGAKRSYRIKVYAVDDKGNASVADVINIANAAPALPALVQVVKPRTLTLQLAQPLDADFAGYRVWMSTTLGFTAGPSNLVYEGPGSPTIPIDPDITYYYKYAAIDSFAGATGTIAGLTLSAEQTFTSTSERLQFDCVRTAGITLGDGWARKDGGVNGNWDVEVRSTKGFTGGAHAGAVPAQNNLRCMFGLNSDPTTDASFGSLDYAWYTSTGGTLNIFESGASVGYAGTYAAGDTLDISYDGTTLIYYHNGKPVRWVEVTITTPLYFDSSFRDTGARLDGINFGAGPSAINMMGANFGVRATTGLAVSAHSIRKITGVTTYDEQAYSVESFKGGASCTASPQQTNAGIAFGLSNGPTAETGGATTPPTQLDYAWDLLTTGAARIWEGASVGTFVAAYSAGDTFDVSYDGERVTYYYNGSPVRSVEVTIMSALYFSAWFRGNGAIQGVGFRKGAIPDPTELGFDYVQTASAVQIGKRRIRKTGAGGSWDAQVYSAQGYAGGAHATASPGQTNKAIMFGLNSDPSLDANFTSLDYAWYFFTDGSARIYESNVSIGIFVAAYVAGDVFDVSYDGMNVTYWYNGQLLRTVQANITAKLYFDCSFNTNDGLLTSIDFGRGPVVRPDALPFAYTSTANCVVTQNTAWKTAATAAWDCSIRSSAGFKGGAFACFSPMQADKRIMVGLNSDPATDDSITGLDYAWYVRQDGVARIYESNTDRGTFVASYSAGDVFGVSYDGKAIRYLYNGTVLRTVAVTITSKLYLDSSFYDTQGKIEDLRFGNSPLVGSDVWPSQIPILDQENMVKDPHFLDLGYWAFLSSGVAVSTSSNVTTNLNATQGVLFSLAGQSSGAFMYISPGVDNMPVVEPGLWYRFRLGSRYLTGYTGRACMLIQWYDSAKAAIGSPILTVVGTDRRTVAAGANATEQLDSRAIQAPATARYCNIGPFVECSTTLSNAGSIYFATPVMQKFIFGTGWQLTTGVSGYVTNINPLSAADIGATATISIAAFTIKYTDSNGQSITTAYSAGSITLRAFSTRYYVFANDPGGAGGAVTYVSSTTTDGFANDVNYVYIGSVTTPANGGGGTTGGYDPGGTGDKCVAADAFVDDLRRASELKMGSLLDLLNYDGQGWGAGLIDSAHPARAQGVRITTESGAQLTCSISTPITQPTGPDEYALAGEAIGALCAVKDANGFRWEHIIRLDLVGEIDVVQVHCGGGTFAAGDTPERMIFTHNAVKP